MISDIWNKLVTSSKLSPPTHRVGAGRRNVAAEVQVIDGRSILVVETDNGNIKHVPIQLPQTIWLDGKLQPLVVEAGAVVIPTEDGSVTVPLEEFDVEMVNEQVALVAEETPVFTIMLALVVAKYVAKFLGGKAAVAGVGTAAGATADAGIIAWRLTR